MAFKRILPILAIFALTTFAVPASAAVDLTFGVYTSDNRSAMETKLRPVLGSLEADLAVILNDTVRIRLDVASSYQEGIDRIVEGRVDFARLGPASYVLAKDRSPGMEILAMESKKGQKVFKGVICVAKESPIREVSELRGKSFAFGNENSTIGRYLSQRHLMNNGIRANDLSRYEYLGRHDKVGIAVGRGKFDAGALKNGTFKKLVKKGVPIRAIATFNNVTKPWVAASSLSDRMAKAVRQALLNMSDPDALKALSKDGFLEGNDADYAEIREAIQNNARFFQVNQAAN
jgi:phosphonate transport system substrate-binding protein